MTSLGPRTASADEYKPSIVPECKVYKTTSGKEICGYETIEEVQAVYKADAELYTARGIILSLKMRDSLQVRQIVDLRIAISAKDAEKEIWRVRASELSKEVIAKDKLYQDERVKPRWGSFISWGSTAILGAVLVGFVGKELIE